MRDSLVFLACVAGSQSCELPIAGLTDPAHQVAQVVVVPDSVSLDGSQHLQFAAYGRTMSGDSSAVTVTWKATGGSIASDGTYAADTTAGDFLVTGTDATHKLSASSRVHIRGRRPVASVIVIPGLASTAVGQTMPLTATPRDSTGTALAGRVVAWGSNNTGVATVSSSGVVTGVAAGSATITATSEGKTGTATVTVTQTPAPVASVSVSPTSASAAAGQAVQLMATPRDVGGNALAGRVVTWGSSNTAIATVNGSGLVTGVATGSVTITATSEGKSGTAAITVTSAPAPVASVSVSPASASVTTGQVVPLTATPRDGSGNALTGRVVTWGSGNTGVATVGGSGSVTGVAAGSATITATSEGKSGTATITVTAAPVASVSVSPATASVPTGQTLQLAATPRDGGGNALTGRVVTWGSSNATVATVSGSGLVAGVTAGAATITATSEGKSGTSTLTVTATTGGGTVLFQETFEDNSFGSRSWYDNTSMATTTAEHIPGSTRALEIRFTSAATTPTWGGAARHLFNGTESVYLSYWVKYSANWVGSGKAYHPHEFMFMTSEEDQYAGPSVTHLTTYVEDVYQNGGIPVLAMQDGSNIDQSRIGQDLTNVTENRAASGCNGNTDGYATGCYILGSAYDNEKKFTASRAYFLPTAGPGYKGDWHLVEAYFQLNSIVNGKGVSDGIARYWFDGQLVIDKSNLLFRTGAHPNMKFNQFLIGPYIGDGSPVDQTMWVDNVIVATAKP